MDQACAVWVHLESFFDDRGARAKDPTPKQKRLSFAAKEIKNPKTRSDLISMNTSELSKWIRSQEIVIPGNQAKKKHLVLELAEKIWDAVKDTKSLPENLRIRSPPGTRSDLSLMLVKDLDLWIRSHNVSIGKGVVDIWKELQSLAEQIWDAIQNGTLVGLRKKLRPDKVKVPQTRKDLGQMTGRDLMQWIGPQGVRVGRKCKNKDKILALAETTWDAIEIGTLNNLEKRRRAASNSVKTPEVREDFRQMAVKNLTPWIRSEGVSIRKGDEVKERLMALAERTWDAIESGTLDDLKKGRNLKLGRKPKKAEAL